MNKMERVAVKATSRPVSHSTRARVPDRPKHYRTSAAPREKPKADDFVIGMQRYRILWSIAMLSTLVMPVLILTIAATVDAVPWSPSNGAFIIAAGAILIGASFPFATQYQALSTDVVTEYSRYKTADAAKMRKLISLLLVGAVCAELPSIAGLLHYFVTRELIASWLLCFPAIVMMLVVFRPAEHLTTEPPKSAQ